MATITPAILACWLGEALIRFRPGTEAPRCGEGLRLLNGDEDFLEADCLFAAEAGSAARLIARGVFGSEPRLLITAGALGGKEPAGCPIPPSLTLIETSLPFFPLCNQIQEHLRRFLRWDESLQNAVYTNAGLQTLLERAGQAFHASLFLVNAGFKLIAAVPCPDLHDPTVEELFADGYQSFESIQAIRRETPLKRGRDAAYVEYISSVSNNYTIARLIRYNKSLVARLCLVLDGPQANACYSDLLAVLAGYVTQYMFNTQGMDYSGNAAFGLLAADLIECRLTSPEELSQRLKQIRLAARRYYHLMLISFSEPENRSTIPWNYVISQLEHLFPYSNITTYRGQILLMLRKMKRGRALSFDRSALLRLLETYGGYAAISNTSEFLTSMPPVYYQTQSALRLGQVMHPEERIIYYEDYSIYQIIEMAAETARQTLGSRNLVHLCNNELIALILHDKKNGSCLTDVAYAYLAHERNTGEAAAALYIHRNTMLYKLHKIEEIIGGSLDDPLLRERMMFGYHVLEYMKYYRKEDILTLKSPH